MKEKTSYNCDLSASVVYAQKRYKLYIWLLKNNLVMVCLTLFDGSFIQIKKIATYERDFEILLARLHDRESIIYNMSSKFEDLFTKGTD